MPGRERIEDLSTEELMALIKDSGDLDALLNDPYMLCSSDNIPDKKDTISCGEEDIKSQFYLNSQNSSFGSSECPPVEDTFEEEDPDLDPGFYRQLIEDEIQNKKFAKIRKSLDIAIQCSAKQCAQDIESFIKTSWAYETVSKRKEYLYNSVYKMARVVFDLTEKGEVEFLAKTWERRGGTTYEDEEDEKKISLLTLNLGGEENAIFVKKTRAVTKKYMYKAMKQALEQLVKDFDLNEADGMLI